MIGRIAAVDYGRRRIGLAVCDPLGITVTGLDTVSVEGSAQAAAAAVAAVLKARGVARVVVGLPLHADGRESEMSREARAFGDALGRALSREVTFVDETLTSIAAQAALAEGRRSGYLRRRQARERVDRLAACLIAEQWMNEQQ